MDTDPKRTRKDAVRRAEHLAGEHLPSWLRAAHPESRLPVLCALITAIALQLAIPRHYTLVPRWPLITMEVLLLVVLVILNPVRLTGSTQLGRYTSWALLAAITIDNTASAALLNYQIVTGRVNNNAAVLLGSRAAISIANIIAFGIWYWELELDSGGPFTRRTPSSGTRTSCSHRWPIPNWHTQIRRPTSSTIATSA
jgi:hypothetical protein